MRILLAATNRERSPFPVAPLGALCVAAATRRAGHEVEFFDLGTAFSPVRALRTALGRGRFDAVAFSIRNLDNCSCFMAHSYAEEVRELAAAVRQGFAGPLILGGSGFSVSPRGWMQRLGADYGVIGEGEQAFVELLRVIEGRGGNAECGMRNAELSLGARTPSSATPASASNPEYGMQNAEINNIANIPGVITASQAAEHSDSNNHCPPTAPIADLDTLAPPEHARCRYAKYLAHGGFVSVQTKRGCPFGCIYCIYPQLEGRRYRLRAPGRVVDEIEEVARSSGAQHFFFVDSVFNDPREHALAVCAELARRQLPARWMAFCNPVGFDAELARAMVAAGCVGIEFGLDAATDKMLVALHKPFDQAQIAAAMEAAAAAGLLFAVHLLFGGPGETWDDVEATQAFLNDCAPASGIFASLGIRIYEGTPLERLAAKEGALPPGADLFEPHYYISPAMADDSAARLDAIVRRRPEWSSPVDWGKPVMRWTQYVLNRLGVRPQWKNVRNYGKHMRR